MDRGQAYPSIHKLFHDADMLTSPEQINPGSSNTKQEDKMIQILGTIKA